MSTWKRPERPTGIIRALPSLAYSEASVGARRYQQSIDLLERGRLDAIYIALQSIPKFDVVHMYLIIDGAVDVRLNIAGYEAGDSRECWDRTIRKPKHWAVCTAPVVRPPERVERKGFQGFRYTSQEELW
jgi:hypothetical protein